MNEWLVRAKLYAMVFPSRALRALNPLVMEREHGDQRVIQAFVGLGLTALCLPIFADRFFVIPDPGNQVELAKHGLTLGLTSAGGLQGLRYLIPRLG